MQHTHFDRLGEEAAQGALRPRRPAERAINPNRKTRCPAGEAINSSSPDGCPEGEGPTSNSAVAAFPSGRLYGLPVQQGSRTQVSMVGNLGKSLTAQPLLPHLTPEWKPFGQLQPKVFTFLYV